MNYYKIYQYDYMFTTIESIATVESFKDKPYLGKDGMVSIGYDYI